MRVLIVTQYFWPEPFGINEISKALVERGHCVDVLTGKPNYPEGKYYLGYRGWGLEQDTWSGVEVFRMPLLRRGNSGTFRLALNYLSFIISGIIFGPWLLRKRSYDVIFVYGISPILQAIPAILLKRLKRSPLIIWVQDLWPESLEATGHIRNRFLLAFVGKIVKLIYHYAELILVQSQAFIAPVSELASDATIKYYPNSIDPGFSRPSNVAVPEISGLEEGFPILFAGNVGAAQAVEVIVEAASLLKEQDEIRFIVLGQGSRWEWLHQQLIERNLSNVYLPGRYPVETMPGIMQKAAALLVSLRDTPNFAATVPNKIQAYMAAGRPIIACLNGEGARTVTDAGAGLAVPAENAKALAEAVSTLYNMSVEDRNKMGASGRMYYKKYFDHDLLIGRLVEHFHSVSGSTRRDIE